jgi:hypothetical protein
MGIKLWVDDLRQEPADWVWAKTATEAIRILDTQDVEEVSLDHDITHSHPTDTGRLFTPTACPETYEAVARFIAAKPGGIKRVHIHTANPGGAQRMALIIGGAQPHIKLSRRLGEIYEEADPECKVDGQD